MRTREPAFILAANCDSHTHSTTSFAVVAETCYQMLEVGSIFAIGRMLITFLAKKVYNFWILILLKPKCLSLIAFLLVTDGRSTS